MGNSEIVSDTKIYPFLLKLQTGDRKYFVNGMQGSVISKKNVFQNYLVRRMLGIT